ncbi:DoxX family protein [Corynebacterium kalidii]
MGLFDRTPGKSGASGDDASTTPSGRVDHGDDDLFDAIDAADGIDVPDVTRPLDVPRAETPAHPEPTEPAEVSAVADHGDDQAPEGEPDPADPADPADATDLTDPVSPAKPKRDIYAVSGRARPQRIEPRSAEPVRPQELTDDTKTEVFGAAGVDPAYTGANPGAEDQNQTLVFGGQAGASGRATYGTDGTVGTVGTDGTGAPSAAAGDGQESAETSVFAVGPAGTRPAEDAPVTTPVSPVFPDDPRTDADPAAADTPAGDPRRGTLDFGLFLLRVVIGGLLVVRGLQTLFAFGGDPGISALEQTLSAYSVADILAVALPVAQIVAGGLLVFGLLTPVGGALTVAVAGFLALHNVSLWDSGYWPYTLSPQVQYWGLTGLAGLVLTFTGPGRYSADVSRGWATRPLASAWVFFVVGLAGAAGLWLAVGGGSPF